MKSLYLIHQEYANSLTNIRHFWFNFSRYNLNGVDLETSFPDYFAKSNQHFEPEVQAIKDWSSTQQFVLSGHFKSGDFSATYPFHNPENSVITFTKGAQTPDDDVFQYLSTTYMKSNPTSDQDFGCQVMFQTNFQALPDIYRMVVQHQTTECFDTKTLIHSFIL